jgi:hypothetical protein
MHKPFGPLVVLCAAGLVFSVSAGDARGALARSESGQSNAVGTPRAAVPRGAPRTVAEGKLREPSPWQSRSRAAVLVHAQPIPAIPEERIVLLDFPSEVRLGDVDAIRLSFSAGGTAASNLPAEIPLDGPGAAQPFQDAYDTYNVIVEAQLDLAGVETLPSGPVSERLIRGDTAIFAWKIRPAVPGTYHGTAWLFLIFVDRQSGAESRIPISAQPMAIRVTAPLGLSGPEARVAGGAGLVASIALLIPLALDALEQQLRARRSPRKSVYSYEQI